MSPTDQNLQNIDPSRELAPKSVTTKTGPDSYTETFQDGHQLKFTGVTQAGEAALGQTIEVQQVTTPAENIVVQSPESNTL